MNLPNLEDEKRYPSNPLQLWVDHANAVGQAERATQQLTLGKLIALLEGLPPDTHVKGFGALASYRGYYDDLAFAPSEDTQTVAELLTQCRAAMGRVYEGYKGGDFLMGERTPLWIAAWGDASGVRLIGLATGNPLEPITAPEGGSDGE